MNDINTIESILTSLYDIVGNSIPIIHLKQQLKLDDEGIKRIVNKLKSEGICLEDLDRGYGAYGELILTQLGHKIKTNHGSYSDYLKYLEREETRTNNLEQLQEQNLRLQNKNLTFQQTIQEQEQRIRDLDEQQKFINVIKEYWWLITSAFGLGILLSKVWNKIAAFF